MINKVASTLPLSVSTPSVKPVETQQNFGNVLQEAIGKLNDTQNQSDIMTNKLANGENVELHQVMITAQKASVSMQLAMEVRNKVIEAYQEVMRMQM